MPANSENELVYPNMSVKKGVTDKQLLKGRKHFFTKHDGISCCIKTWKISVVFIHPAKINSVLL